VSSEEVPGAGLEVRAAQPHVSALAQALLRPEQLEKLPPCSTGCAAGSDVRGWIAVLAQQRKAGLSRSEAYGRAWTMLAAVNPFPATMGRICSHPCEDRCHRRGKDGAVSINALERFLGDWGLRHKLKLPRSEQAARTESVGVIGAGPAGLSFAYQMARRGYPVTLYEKQERPGGMLQFGIPEYRLPEVVLQAEIARILDLGVALKLNSAMGRDVSAAQLRERHDVLFVGIGAGMGLKLGIPGEEGVGVWTGLDFLSQVNRGMTLSLGGRIVVVGGGNTAMDAARSARRRGAQVTILYRRTREEMPALESEVENALQEGVALACCCAPCEIVREHGQVRAVRVQGMQPGAPDESGRRKPLPVGGSQYQIPADAVIAAVSGVPEWKGLEDLRNADTWAGGDALRLGSASMAIGQGRRAAEAAHARLRKLPLPAVSPGMPVTGDAIRPEYHAAKARSNAPWRAAPARLLEPDLEAQETMSEAAFLQEACRCFCCGSCYGCEHCFMYCNAGAFSRLSEPRAGTYFSLDPDSCEGCGKCIEICPSGYLSPRQSLYA
jgi:NADPH-dependent glutamate synthase beta subunit-like oxidoreductase/ferredoxin